MWTWQDVDEAYLERMVDDYPYLMQYIQAVEAIHGKAMMAYLTYMTQRMLELHRVLKDTGSLYLHCDQTASHYLRVMLDRIFGTHNFMNEVIWGYSTSGRSGRGARKKWARKHDCILCYAKDAKQLKADCTLPCTPEYIASHYKQKDENGNKCRIRKDAGKVRIYYPDEGMNGNDWWSDIPYVNSQARERTGYPTQKPLTLLRRIIEASSNKGDVVLDPFAGCATTCVAAQQLQRKWIGIDIEAKAAELVVQRLSDDSGLFKDFIHRTDVPQRTDIKVESADSKSVKERLFKVQEGKCNGCQTKMDARHFEVDHIIPRSKGGGDYYENYQLLCGNCNRIKGDRPMEYLRAKIAKRAEHMQRKITFGT